MFIILMMNLFFNFSELKFGEKKYFKCIEKIGVELLFGYKKLNFWFVFKMLNVRFRLVLNMLCLVL